MKPPQLAAQSQVLEAGRSESQIPRYIFHDPLACLLQTVITLEFIEDRKVNQMAGVLEAFS